MRAKIFLERAFKKYVGALETRAKMCYDYITMFNVLISVLKENKNFSAAASGAVFTAAEEAAEKSSADYSGGLSLYAKLGIICAALIAVFIIIFLIARKLKEAQYFKKPYLTQTEIRYFEVILSVLGNDYLVYPQVNLAAVLDKKGGSNGRTELFRNADFGVFTKEFELLALIEINDASHLRKDRMERDKKVAKICRSAGVPIITFWTKDKLVPEKIARELHRYLR